MYSPRRKALSQNFLYSRKLVDKLVRHSSIGLQDTVIDIGAGKGIITEQLLSLCRKVIAIEIDQDLYFYLKNKFKDNNVDLICGDFLRYYLPKYPYKVFANIPFNIEGRIIRRLLDAPNPPEDCYLVMREDLAYRLAGIYREGEFSISHKPWFDFEIVHHFRRTDFEPMARMNTILLRITKKKQPLIPWKKRGKYASFIKQSFMRMKRPSKIHLRQWVLFFS